MKENLFELGVRVHGHDVKEYFHEGKTYIEGREGSEFTLYVANHTPNSVLAVVSVDGLSVMDGKEADYSSGGYVLKPYEKLDIPGWRLDLKNVAKFMFTIAGKSYAVKVDKPTNVGVIGCAFFAQKDLPLHEVYKIFTKEHHHHHYPYQPYPYDSYGPIWLTSDTSEPRGVTFDTTLGLSTTLGSGELKGIGSSKVTCSTNDEPVVQQVGTGFGQQASHEVNTVMFARADSPAYVIEILYDSRENLVKRGVDLKPKATVAVPRAFPGAFCTPPAGWVSK